MTEFEDKNPKQCTGTCIIHAALPYVYVVQCSLYCTASSNLLTLVQEDRPEMSCRSDACESIIMTVYVTLQKPNVPIQIPFPSKCVTYIEVLLVLLSMSLLFLW